MARRVPRRFAGLLVALAACMTVAPSAPAVAAPAPGGAQEWWFDSWHVEEVWKQTTGAGVTVAVLDSGVAANLPDLAGHVVPGADFTGQAPRGQRDVDPKSHGTVMASLIVSQGRTTGMFGVAPGAQVMPVAVGADGPTLPPEITAKAIRYAVDHGADVVNMSYGDNGDVYPNGCPAEVLDAVRYAVDHDVVPVAAPGNDGDGANRISFPASCPGVLTVGAVDEHAQPWVKTARHDYVDVAAPGVDTVGFDREGQLVIGDGTSGAAALTSGAVALLRARYPQLNARQIVARLLATLGDRPSDGKDPARGYGTIRLLSAVTKDVPADAPNPVFDELTPPTPTNTPAAAADEQDGTGTSNTAARVALAVGIAAAFGLLVLVVLMLARRRRRPAWGGNAPGPYGFAPPGPPPGPMPPGPPQAPPPMAAPGWPAGGQPPSGPPPMPQGGYVPPMQPPPPPGGPSGQM